MYYVLQEPFRKLQYQYKEAVVLGANQNDLTLPQNTPAQVISHKVLEIMKLCNGRHDINSIVTEIWQAFPDTNEEVVKSFVNDCLLELTEKNIVTLINQPLSEAVTLTVTGSKEYWTPAQVFLELTSKCPLLCRHCCLDVTDGETMDDTVLNSVIDDLKILQPAEVCLTGGEPLWHPQFREAVVELLNSNIKVIVTTSGYINDASINKVLQLITPDKGYIQVGLDGLEKTHVAICGKEDSFFKSIAFIKQMLAAKLKVIVAITYINQRFDELDELCNYLKVLGVSGVKLRIAEALSNNIEQKACELVRVKSLGGYLKTKYENAVFKVEYEDRQSPAPDEQQKNCGAGRDLYAIDPQGYIKECVLTADVVGRVTEEKSFIDFLRANSENIYLKRDKKSSCIELCSMVNM